MITHKIWLIDWLVHIRDNVSLAWRKVKIDINQSFLRFSLPRSIPLQPVYKLDIFCTRHFDPFIARLFIGRFFIAVPIASGGFGFVRRQSRVRFHCVGFTNLYRVGVSLLWITIDYIKITILWFHCIAIANVVIHPRILHTHTCVRGTEVYMCVVYTSYTYISYIYIYYV